MALNGRVGEREVNFNSQGRKPESPESKTTTVMGVGGWFGDGWNEWEIHR